MPIHMPIPGPCRCGACGAIADCCCTDGASAAARTGWVRGWPCCHPRACAFRVLANARFGLRETGRVGEADLRVERLGLLHLGERVGGTAFAIEHLGVQIVRARIVRMRLQHFAQTGVGLLPVALRHGRFDLLNGGHSERRGRHEQQ